MHSLSHNIRFTATTALGLLTAAQHVLADQFYQLNLNTGTVSPDGFERTAVTTNGSFGAPLITANLNDRLFVNVSNSMTSDEIRQSTSIHWHGIFQHKTSAQDGVAMVSQCPISPGSSFEYNFSTAGQTGTYWYHSHLSTQYCDGLRGPLVIYDPDDPFQDLYDVDDETTVITLGDWYHDVAKVAGADETILAPSVDSTLINGLGRYVGGPSSDLAVLNVTSGKRYRFRLVNIACQSFFDVSIDGHNFTVIEADGIEHEPLAVDSLTIFPGQRYSIILEANQTVGNYWFRTSPTPSITNFTSSSDVSLNNAILRYEGADDTEPTTSATTSTNALVEADMIPLVNPGAPGGSAAADLAINLEIGLSFPNWTLNGVQYIPPDVPVLLQILSGTAAASLLPSGSVYELPKNSVIEVSIPDANAVARAHPFHLHGHTFDVIRSAGQTDYNYVNPPRRDVVAVHSGNVTFRFETDNAGPWILHCHIDWHLERGLAIVFAEDVNGTVSGANATYIPPAWDNLCTTYDALDASQQ